MGFYQLPPPPPPEPPPDIPPPLLDEPPPLLEDGLDDMALDAEVIVEVINAPKVAVVKLLPEYQSGAFNNISSNFLIHLSDTSST